MSSLPLLSASLLVSCMLLALLSARGHRRDVRLIGLLATFLVCLIPYNGLSLAHFIRILCGDLSPVSIALLITYAYCQTSDRRPNPMVLVDCRRLAILVSATAVVLYPSALGVSAIDIYSHGYYPVVLTPILMTLLGLAVCRGWYYLGSLIVVAWASYCLQLLDSDNLWDYLLDPILALYCLYNLTRAIRELRAGTDASVLTQQALLFVVGAFVLFAVPLSHLDPDAFRNTLVKEDGFVEWSTVVILAAAAVVCGRRAYRLRRNRSAPFLGVTAFLTIVCIFGVGEEISWGQRILNIDTPEFFMAHNKQQETGLHNLAFEVSGEQVSINKLIFGTGLALGMLVYLCVMTPLYRTKPAFAHWLDRLAVPMPKNYHIAGYLIVVAVVEILIDSSKRGEMTELAGSAIFLLNIAYPWNPHIYDAGRSLDTAETE